MERNMGMGSPAPVKTPQPPRGEAGRGARKHMHRIDRAIKHVVKNSEPVLLSETADFNEYIFQAGNLVALLNTSNYRWMLIKFKDEKDAEEFKNMLLDVSNAIGKYFASGLPLFFFSGQREFIRTLVSFYDEAKIVCYARSIDVDIKL